MKKEKIFWGIFFVIAAIFLIVSRLGYLDGVNVISLILTILLVACMIKSVRHLNFAGILFPVAFLCIIYDKVLGITAITPWTVLGAALFGSIGLSILFHNKHHYRHFMHDENFAEIIDQEDGNSVQLATSFGSSIKYVNSDDFKQANLKCSFGAMKVYFDNAMIRNNNAIIQLDISFAGVELFIPKEWNVKNQANTSFGEIEEKNKNQTTGIPSVTLVGNISFSGVTIIYV